MNLKDFTYLLPQDRIALYPLSKRDSSKLLVYDQGEIKNEQFSSLDKYIPEGSILFFNDTKVIPARLHFTKETGAEIEIFLLSPVLPSVLVVEAMQATHTCSWKCTIGNLKKWNEGKSLSKNLNHFTVEAHLENREEGIVKFSWQGNHSFAEVVNLAGETPLPPYLKRNAEASDRERYQTIYSHYEGAVAAPTAGLHFTHTVFEKLKAKNIQTDFVTLHVSAGTFQPIKTEDVDKHIMHHEQIIITRNNLVNLLHNKFTIPVGTTSMRTLESLYWFGVKLVHDPNATFHITQHDPYGDQYKKLSRNDSFERIFQYMDQKEIDILQGETSIYIMPGYEFKVCDALITNFHQPGSTLIVLVSAFIGENWKKVYATALDNNYRFLSYGDSSILIPKKN
ncbi:MAG TPA: S-adenosylmethionine:tRNA ribosyltransferase-isomerase [Chryseolinea sp.]|nr:S-adenosylmethionine:tRNA ribosyltransferase-isomerase [Chryseolinea sp.]HPH46800.1 S-adenosylmethionine:tRNA ribosyltransferase-isomerase [Chryseolinea sp.]HPM32375.1 S-adenosylmethionine:tRNA ribosyltransferase-isomerase [Chryseolinea sp.]